MQIGTEYVSNNWIARMDSDDISVPNRFEKQLNEIKKKPNLAIVGGQVSEFVGNVNNIVGYRKVPINNDSIKRFVKWRSPFNHPTVMINKKKLKEVGGYRSFGNVEDYYLWVRFIIEKFEVCNLAEVLTLMRVDEGLYSRRGNTKNLVFFYKLRKIMKKNKIISYKEEVLGNILITANILLPETLRKFFYQYFLHSKIGRKNKIK